MHVLADDSELAAFFAGFLVVPSVEIQATFDVDRSSFREILLSELGLASPEGDFDECGLFLFLTLVIIPNTVDGHADFRNRSAFGSVAKFGISGEIADEHDFVEIGHNERNLKILARGCEQKT